MYCQLERGEDRALSQYVLVNPQEKLTWTD
jgi:hypothetical protein